MYNFDIQQIRGSISLQGRIKMYNSQKGFGFIIGEDGKDYFFHISNIKSIELPQQGYIVEYNTEKGEKGYVAKNIKVQKTDKKPIFISFGNTRIKINSIKNYGISTDTGYYEKTTRMNKRSISNPNFLEKIRGTVHIYWSYTGEDIEIDQERYDDVMNYRCHNKYAFFKKGEKVPEFSRYRNYDNITEYNWITASEDNIYMIGKSEATPEDVYSIKRTYLYVTTYQKDNYTFYQNEVSWNIVEKRNELDRYLCL